MLRAEHHSLSIVQMKGPRESVTVNGRAGNSTLSFFFFFLNSDSSFFPHCPFWGEANVFVLLTLNHLLRDSVLYLT